MRQKSAGALKEVVAELTLENRLLKKSVTRMERTPFGSAACSFIGSPVVISCAVISVAPCGSRKPDDRGGGRPHLRPLFISRHSITPICVAAAGLPRSKNAFWFDRSAIPPRKFCEKFKRMALFGPRWL
jgi:hypothetical protein